MGKSRFSPVSPLGYWGTALFLLGIFCRSSTLLAATPPELISQGNTAYSAGRYPQAEFLYLQADRLDPLDPSGYYGAALCEYCLGNFTASESNLKKALSLHPGLQKAQQLLKKVQDKLNEQQINDLEFLVTMKQGVLYYRGHQYTKALELFEKARALNSVSEELHFNLGLTYLKLRKWDEAESELRECLKLQPNDLRAQYALGVLYEKIGATLEAQDYFLSVAQSPNAGLYNMRAMMRLASLKSEVSTPFHFSLRLQGGGSQTTMENMPSGPGSPPSTNNAVNQYGHLQLSYSPRLAGNIVNFSYGLDGAWSQSPGQISSFYDWHDLAFSSQATLPSNFYLPFSFDEQVGLNSVGNLFYQHHQGSLGLQWIFQNVDTLQFQLQVLREIFFQPTEVGTDSWIGSVSASAILGTAHFFSLSYSFRQCRADTFEEDFYDFYLHSLSATYHVELGGGWNASLNYTPQWQTYPYFYDANGNPRRDWVQSASLEFGIPVMPHWSVVLGDQFQKTNSTFSVYSLHSNNYYAATQVSF